MTRVGRELCERQCFLAPHLELQAYMQVYLQRLWLHWLACSPLLGGSKERMVSVSMAG